jgi:hypothetical protein
MSLNYLASRIYCGLRGALCDKVIVYASMTDNIDNAPRLVATIIHVRIEDPNLQTNKPLLELQKHIMDLHRKLGRQK